MIRAGLVLTAVDLVGLLVGDLNAELLLYRHDDLDRVQAVQAEVVAEVGRGLDLSDTQRSVHRFHRPSFVLAGGLAIPCVPFTAPATSPTSSSGHSGTGGHVRCSGR